MDRTHCNQPDRDMPKLACGRPLPCPHHTSEIDLLDDGTAIVSLRGPGLRAEKQLLDVAEALIGEHERREEGE